MKTHVKMIIIAVLLGSGLILTPEANAHRRHHHELFYHDLLPYGRWISTPDYGMVWIPNTGGRFHPYETNGHWVYTYFGWTWVSYYSWGWAPFHYGRWYYDPWYGWAWVPGNEWGPGWVAWSQCDGYYGWAPLSPVFSFHGTYNVRHDVPANHWVYVQAIHFGAKNESGYHHRGKDAERLHRKAVVLPGTTASIEKNSRHFSGPEVREVRKVTGREYRPADLGKQERTRQITKSSDPVKTVHKREVKSINPRTPDVAGKASIKKSQRQVVSSRDGSPAETRTKTITRKSVPAR